MLIPWVSAEYMYRTVLPSTGILSWDSEWMRVLAHGHLGISMGRVLVSPGWTLRWPRSKVNILDASWLKIFFFARIGRVELGLSSHLRWNTPQCRLVKTDIEETRKTVITTSRVQFLQQGYDRHRTKLFGTGQNQNVTSWKIFRFCVVFSAVVASLLCKFWTSYDR